jgi:hypothetical protein
MAKAGQRLACGLGVLLAVAWAWNMPWHRFASGWNDFLPLYAGGRLAGSGELYSSTAQERIQREVAGDYLRVWQFIRPPFYAWVLKPLAGLPYRTAYWLWQALSAGAFGWFVWRFRKETPELPWLALMSVPMLSLWLNGQDTALWLAAAGWAVLLLRRDRDYAAGLVLALCAAKFHLFILVPVALVAGRRWKALAGGAGGAAVLYLLSVPGQGWGWPAEYARMLMTAPVHPERYTLPNVRGLVMALGLPEAATTAVAGAVVAWAVCRKGAALEERLGMALAGGLLLSRHAFIQDCVVLYATLVFAPATRPLLVVLLTPLLYFVLLAEGPLSALMPAVLAAVPVVFLAKLEKQNELHKTGTPVYAGGGRGSASVSGDGGD